MGKILNTIFILSLVLFSFNCDDGSIPIEITDYVYPTADENDGIYRVAIFGTNDIHGGAFPLDITHPVTKETYKYGGLEYLASYVKILREEWQERFLWLDGGDQFQCAIESKISNGTIITDFFNTMKVTASAIGNHEWDYGQNYLKSRLSSSTWDYLAANVVQKSTNQPEFLPRTKVAKLVTVGKVKLGLIGLSTIETPFTTGGDLTNIKFVAYRDIIIKYSNLLKSLGANAILLTAHLGMKCPNDIKEKMLLKLRNPQTEQAECNSEDEMSVLLNSLEEGTIDAVISGHIHDVAHHWINGIPVVQTINGGFYSHVIYLTFDEKTLKLQKDEIQVEGPLPTCEKVFRNTKRCSYITHHEAKHAGDLTSFSFHNILVESEIRLHSVFEHWWKAAHEYKVNLAVSELELARDPYKENVLGNIAADALKAKTNSDFSVLNFGALRSTWFPGNIKVEHLWNMFPFDNFIVSFEMTGAEVKRMLKVLQGGKKGLYSTAGVTQKVYTNPHELIEVKMFDGSEIVDAKTYKVATVDFLLGGGDDFKDVLKFYTAKNVMYHGHLRTQMINFIKALGTITEARFLNPNHMRINLVTRPNAVKGAANTNSFIKKNLH